MPIEGTWKAQSSPGYAGARRQGTGWNPIHAVRDGEGRNIAPDGTSVLVPSNIVESEVYEQYGYSDEDVSSTIWGYGYQTGTAERPDFETVDDRNSSGSYPAYAPQSKSGIPSGWLIRTINRGATAANTSKLSAAKEDASAGWRNKETGSVETSVVSDPSQYEMQTSMSQLDKVREGSQRGSGSASEYVAPIRSERPTWGQHRFTPSGEMRHADMEPKSQDLILRHFRYKNAGTGRVQELEPNEMYVSQPRQRIPGSDPWQGQDVSQTVDGYIDEGDSYYVG